MKNRKISGELLWKYIPERVTGLIVFIIVSVLLFYVPVMAETEGDEIPVSETGGVIFKEYPERIYKGSKVVSSYSDFPDRINLSNTQYFPPIRNQQGNSCVAWSQVYYQFTYEVARLNNWDAKHDDSKVFSPKYVWNYLNDGENKGLEMEACYYFLKQQGSLRWPEFPQNDLSFDWYTGTNEEITVNTLRNALKTRVSKNIRYNFARTAVATPVTSNKDSDLVHMKQILNEGHVLSVSTQCKVNGTINNKILSNGERGIVAGEVNNEGHALTIVGYDDNIYYDMNGNGKIESFEQGAFLAANSWGNNAADHNSGYIWIMYDALNEISNVSELNIPGRQRFIAYNEYWYMEVENYIPKRMVEITLEQRYRNELIVSLHTTRALNALKYDQYTFLNQAGGRRSFDGGDNGCQTRTFVFAYEDEEDIDNKIFEIRIEDIMGRAGTETTVKKVRWVGENGKVLKTINPQETFNFDKRFYHYGIPVKSLTLNKTSSTLYVGESEQLTASMLPENATEKKVTWKSSNTSVVQVDWETGKVTCVGTGTAAVTATATDGSGVSASCTYRINDDYHDTPEKAFAVFLHGKIPGAINRSGDVDYFKFTPEVTGTYLIYTDGSTDTTGYLYDADQNILLQNDDAGLLGKNFALQCRLEAGKTYYIKVNGYSMATGAYTLYIAKDLYSVSLASLNQDARRVRMQGEAASVLTSLKLTIGSRTYVLERPASGNLETEINGARFKVTFIDNNNGLSAIWKIEADIPATAGGGESVSFEFSKGSSIRVKSGEITGLIAYGSAIRTGVEADAADSLQRLLAVMKQTNHTLTVRNQTNVLVNVTSATRAATGMKIIERDQNGWIVKIHYLVVFGDVTGDGLITTDDGLAVLQAAAGAGRLGALAEIAADADHNGFVTTDDSLKINQHTAGVGKINQNYTITEVPDDCYYLDPVIF